MTHLLSLSVAVDPNYYQWHNVWEILNRTANEIGHQFPSVTLSSHVVDHEENELEAIPETDYYDENTTMKVYEALRKTGLSEAVCNDAIREIQNAGILFRERRSS